MRLQGLGRNPPEIAPPRAGSRRSALLHRMNRSAAAGAGAREGSRDTHPSLPEISGSVRGDISQVCPGEAPGSLAIPPARRWPRGKPTCPREAARAHLNVTAICSYMCRRIRTDSCLEGSGRARQELVKHTAPSDEHECGDDGRKGHHGQAQRPQPPSISPGFSSAGDLITEQPGVHKLLPAPWWSTPAPLDEDECGDERPQPLAQRPQPPSLSQAFSAQVALSPNRRAGSP